MVFINRHNKLRLRIRVVLVTCATSALAATASASMGYGTHYAAGFCFAEDSSSLDKINYESGIVNNNASSGNVNIMCPISIGQYWTPTSWLSYVDDSGTKNLTCVHNWTDDEGDLFFTKSFTSSGSSSASKRFYVTHENSGAFRKNWRCTLPPSTNVFISGYYYDADIRHPG